MFSRLLPTRRDREAAFTLPELMITIAIIGIIMAIAIPTYAGARRGAMVTQLKTDVTSSAMGVSTYYNRYGQYPPASKTAAGASTGDTTFATKVAVISNTTAGVGETMDFIVPDQSTRTATSPREDVCVQGKETIEKVVRTFSYNLATKQLVEGGCTFADALPLEPVQ